jgi:hypothetical protein
MVLAVHGHARQTGQRLPRNSMERIHEGDATKFATVLKVFGIDYRTPTFMSGSPDQGIPERDAMLPNYVQC